MEVKREESSTGEGEGGQPCDSYMFTMHQANALRALNTQLSVLSPHKHTH